MHFTSYFSAKKSTASSQQKRFNMKILGIFFCYDRVLTFVSVYYWKIQDGHVLNVRFACLDFRMFFFR